MVANLDRPEIPWQPGELRVLVVDDEPDVCLGLKVLTESLGAQVETSASAEEALVRLEKRTPHVVISDITMPGKSGLELLREIKQHSSSVRVILITGFGTIEIAVTALHNGASHFITKPFDNEEILSSLRRFGREALLEEELRRLSLETTDKHASPLIVRDPNMKAVVELVAQVAPTPMTVLIEGESGTGKEKIAREIHDRSQNRDRTFLAINTAAVPDTLLESELFGHRKGAFTGADSPRKGIFEQARGGTVFLDEIGLMSRAFQDKLLRVLQEKTVIPLGSAQPVAVDFRLVAATSRDLKQRIERGEFHEDLYYRLHVVAVRIPPLRERREDILPLANHFLARYAAQLGSMYAAPPRLSEAVLGELQAHAWPGNVRELENCIQRALVLARGNTVDVHHLGLHDESPSSGGAPLPPGLNYEEGKQRAVEHFQRNFLRDALHRSGGNVTQAAQACGLTRAALQRIMRTLSLNRESFLKD